jgi:hypothetical protein
MCCLSESARHKFAMFQRTEVSRHRPLIRVGGLAGTVERTVNRLISKSDHPDLSPVIHARNRSVSATRADIPLFRIISMMADGG